MYGPAGVALSGRPRTGNLKGMPPEDDPVPDPTPPDAPAPAQPAPPPDARRGPPEPGPVNRGDDRGPRRPPPRGDRPKPDGTKPAPLDQRDFAALRPDMKDLDASLEAEMNAALAGFDVSGTIVEEETRTKQKAIIPGVQPKKRGKVLGVHGKDVFVDVPGGRGQGVLQLLQFDGKMPAVGEEVEFDIERYDAANGLLVLTMHGSAQTVTDWSSLARGMIVEAKVTGLNKSKTGLQIEVNGIKGFMPISQIDMYRVEKPEDYVNQKLKCVVTDLEPSERNLVVSRRGLLERQRQEQAEAFWAAIEEGQVKQGIVRSVKPFGAFVDLGGADGLIPTGEMSWSRIGDPSEVVQIGQKVEVIVHRLDRDARKIGLSLKQLLRSPWDDFALTHKPGARVTGKVTRIMEFGAFVEVAPGIEGLVHVSELGTMRVRRVRDAVTEGQEVTVQIISVDPEGRRMSLSLKALQAEADAEDAAKTDAEKEADIKEAEVRMAARASNPNLRGGIGANRVAFEMGE